MAASGGRYRLAWFETLLDDCQLLLGCPPPTANITRQQFNMSILVRHKPVLKSVLEPFCLCRLSGRNGGQFTNKADLQSAPTIAALRRWQPTRTAQHHVWYRAPAYSGTDAPP